jgi:hypothetical protein
VRYELVGGLLEAYVGEVRFMTLPIARLRREDASLN